MKPLIRTYLFLLCLVRAMVTQAQDNRVTGTVRSAETRLPLHGATVHLKESTGGVLTDSLGRFRLAAPKGQGVLTVSFVGFRSREIPVPPNADPIEVFLEPAAEAIPEVVVSTGYQQVPAERATGSFVQLDNKLLNRRISTGILDRLEDVTPGLLFNKGKSAGANLISIRGQNTIYGNANPLVVLDNFPFDGDINDINPNDVESISVLKDAAAASIWGSRAGNGVIVITTKKGKYNQALKIGFNAAATVGEKPDLFYQLRMSSADFAAMERQLFASGFYEQAETGYNNPAITPVAEILIAGRDGRISASEADRQIRELTAHDVRDDFNQYFYRKSFTRQYALNLTGGTDRQRFNLSAGYDHNRENLVRNGYERYTFNAGQTLSLLKKKLEISTGFYYTQSNTVLDNPGTGLIGLNTGNGASLYPYARLADVSGNPLAITHDYRESFIAGARQQGLLDWSYSPLAEMRTGDSRNKAADYRINIALSYKIRPYLTAAVLYQYGRSITDKRQLQSLASYYTRNLINNFTQADGAGGLTYAISMGGILDVGNISATTGDFRAQLSFNRQWGEKHSLTAIGGYELRQFHTLSGSNRSYGYDDTHATALPVDYTGNYPQYAIPGYLSTVPYDNSFADLTDRNLSYYANAAYTYLDRYTVSGSGRLDRSNLFGVKANQQGVPLYSAGLSWNISKETFYQVNWLPSLKLRLTYGYNGNVNKSISAYTTAQYLTGNPINTTYAEVINPPNPELRWERVRVINAGIDFASLGNRLSGTIEPYFKRGLDLIGDIPYAPSTGITTFRGNTANTRGHGIDITLNSRNLTGVLQWQSSLLFSYVTDKVVDYALKQDAGSYTSLADNEVFPLAGRPFYAVYSYRFAGLDPQTGDPRGYLNGQPSKDYSGILAAARPDSLLYNGPARPVVFGAFRNTFSYKNFSLSANISYRFGYYFRQRGIFYASVLNGTGYYEGRYAERWQQPGDERHTTVPSLPASIDNARDSFYNYSSATMEKADNIRLQDISLAYEFNRSANRGLPFSRLQVYLYANNIGIIWKATKTRFDPDYPSADYPPVRTVALGLRGDF